jgi:Holliday junction resolvasome RuvABC endonuclease subunit
MARLTVIGVDPGLAAMGLAVVTQDGRLSPPVLQRLAVHQTRKESRKGRRDLRVSADDAHRMRELYDVLAEELEAWDPVNAVAYEVYTPFRAQGGSAWKVARVEGIVVSTAWARKVMVLPYLPFDLKTRIGKDRSASKEDIEGRVRKLVHGASAKIDALPKTLREHGADAIGYAAIGLAEAWEMRGLVGGES